MNDELKTKKELIQELDNLKRYVDKLEKSAPDRNKKSPGQELDEKSRYIFENAKDAMICLDKKGIIIELNKEALRIVGGSKDESIGKHFTKIGIFYPKDIPRLLSSFKTILAGKHSNVNLQIRNKKQETYFLDCSPLLLKTGGKISGMIAMVRDVTENKKAENLLNIQRDLAVKLCVIRDLNDGLRSCLEAAITASGMDCGGIYLVDETSGSLDLIFHKGLSPEFIKSILHHDANSPNTRLVLKGKPVYKCYHELGVPLDKAAQKEQLCAIAVIPILHNRKVIGCLNIASHTLDEVPPFARGALEAIAAQVGSAIVRLKTEKSLHESEEKYREILESSPDAIMLFDADSRQILDINNAAVRLYGYSREEFLKLKHTDITAEKEASEQTIKDLLSGVTSKISFRYHKKKDRTIFPVEISPSIILFKGRKALCGIIRDITERKETEEALRESETRFRQFFENEPVYCYIISTGGKILDINSLALEALGYVKEEVIGKSFIETIYAPSSREKARTLFTKWKSTGKLKNEELNIITKSGEERTVLLSVDAIKDADGEILHSISVQEDITDRKQTENALRESEHRFRSFIEQTTDAVFCYECDPPIPTDLPMEEQVKLLYNCILAECNDVCAKSYGASHAENVIGRRLIGLFKAAPGALDGLFTSMIQSGYRIVDGLGTEVLPDGTKRYYLNNGYGIVENGKLLRVWGTSRNITDRVKAEEQLRKSKETAENYLNIAAEIILSLNAAGTITMLNESGHKILGYKNAELIGKNWFDVCIPLRIRDNVREVFSDLMRGDGENVKRYENPIITKDGKEKIILWHNTILQNETGNICGTLSSGEDITERKKVEEELKKNSIIINSTTDAVVTTDLNGMVTSWNRGAELIYKYKPVEIIGKPVSLVWRKEDFPILESIIADLIAGKEIANYEGVCLDKFGSEISVLLSLTSIKDKAGNVTELVGITKDITDRKRAEEALQERERFLQNIFGAIQDGISVLDIDLNIIKTNFWMEKTYADQMPLLGKKCYRVYQRRESPCPWCPSIRTVETGETNTEIVPYPSEQNPSGWIELTAYPVKDEQGRMTNVIEYVKDITDRKRSEEALKGSETRFRDLAELLPEAVFETDQNLNLTYVNRRAFDLFGYTEEDIDRGLNGFEMIVPEDRDRVKTNMTRRLRGEDPGTVEYTAIRKDGSKFPILFHASSIVKDGRLSGLRGIIIDISDRKRVENALRESEEKYRSFVQNFQGIAFRGKLNFQPLFFHGAVKEITGYAEEDFISGNPQWDQIIHPEDLERLRQSIENIAKKANFVTTREYRILHNNGQIKWVHEQIQNICDSDGKPEFVQGAIYDITEHKMIDEALRTSEERYRLLVDNATEGIVVAQDSFVKFVNPRIEELTLYSRDEILSKPFLDFIHPDDRQMVIENQQKRYNGELSPETYDIRVINKNGETRWIKIGGVIITWGGKPASLNFIVDITETKRLKELESRAERLEMAGTIAGQVAHDFNNLLAPIIAYPEFIRDELPHDHKALAFLNDIENAARKIADINQDLLTMGRRGHCKHEILDLNRVVLQTVQELESTTKTVSFDLRLCDELLNIKGGSAQIHRALTNLLVNAHDSMLGVGNVAITTENYYSDDTSIEYGRVPRGEYVKLTISDTGCGIPDNIIQKIFDPFFSTKKADRERGSGLGLSVVDAVMNDHNGYIDLSSRVGHGTSFYLYFPVAREVINNETPRHLVGGAETVMVVDDDDIQREVTIRLLTNLGYRVCPAESGEKAIEYIRENPQDLVILDMVMPGGIDGTETYRRILEIHPQQKAIILSGFSESERVVEAQRLGAGAFVRKPVTKSVIAAAVRAELDRKAEAVTA